MHSDAAVLKLKSNERELAKKEGSFLDYFFFLSILEAGASAVAVVGCTSDTRKKKERLAVHNILR